MEAIQAHNKVLRKYNELNSTADLLKSENACLSKSLKKAEATISLREVELKQVEQRVEYYQDKSSSMEMYTTVKIRVEMMRDFLDEKASSWDIKAISALGEKMKTLYSESEGEDEP